MKKQKKEAVLTPEDVLKKRRCQLQDRQDIRTFAGRLLLLVFFVWLLLGVLFGLVPAKNEDMKPGIRFRDLQIVWRLPETLHAGDIVVYQEQGQTCTGRIAAVPGDTVELEGSEIVVNGSQPALGSGSEKAPAYDSDVDYPLTLQEDQYFILADNRESGTDSRIFGPVSRSGITGQVIALLRRSSL